MEKREAELTELNAQLEVVRNEVRETQTDAGFLHPSLSHYQSPWQYEQTTDLRKIVANQELSPEDVQRMLQENARLQEAMAKVRRGHDD